MAKLDRDFFKLSPEEQAKSIERDTARLLKRLPELKKNLKMYNEVSDELYNLSHEEVETIGSTYARAVRSGEISTSSSKRAYQKFVSDLRKYARPKISDIAREVGRKRFDSWWETIKKHATTEELEYVNYLVMQMTDEMKLGFTRSRYFIDNSNWNSEDTFIMKGLDDGDISIQALELELFLEKHYANDVTTRSIYNEQVATDGLKKTRRGILKSKKRR